MKNVRLLMVGCMVLLRGAAVQAAPNDKPTDEGKVLFKQFNAEILPILYKNHPLWTTIDLPLEKVQLSLQCLDEKNDQAVAVAKDKLRALRRTLQKCAQETKAEKERKQAQACSAVATEFLNNLK
jgi:hypothetical protein